MAKLFKTDDWVTIIGNRDKEGHRYHYFMIGEQAVIVSVN